SSSSRAITSSCSRLTVTTASCTSCSTRTRPSPRRAPPAERPRHRMVTGPSELRSLLRPRLAAGAGGRWTLEQRDPVEERLFLARLHRNQQRPAHSLELGWLDDAAVLAGTDQDGLNAELGAVGA